MNNQSYPIIPDENELAMFGNLRKKEAIIFVR
jgi:hypothetical protein